MEVMSARERMVIIFRRLTLRRTDSLRETERKTSIPKSSIHRLKRTQKRRIAIVGHSFFETEEGMSWLHRLFIAVLLVFGIQSGVGSEAISLFFELILVACYIGSSPSSIRASKETMRGKIEKFGEANLATVVAHCENKELHLGADETVFGNEQFLIMMEVVSGFLFTEALVTNRKYKTWKEHTEGLLKQFKNICSFISDGGKALLTIGKSVVCDNAMDLFHFLQDMKRLFATKFHSKRQALISQLKKLKKNDTLSDEEKRALEQAINDKMLVLDKGQRQYHQCLFFVSTELHPFKNISQPKSSLELKEQLTAQAAILRTIATECTIDDKLKLLNRIENRVDSSSKLNDLWHNWVDASLQCNNQDIAVHDWAKSTLLPYYYWTEQLRKSKRKERLRIYYQWIVKQARTALDAHLLTREHLTNEWIHWAVAMAKKYQRTTAAIEGRNARLSHHYFATRGVRASHVRSLTILHNFWIKRADKTTAATRLCGVEFPDLFECLIEGMKEIPLPRKGSKKNQAYRDAMAA